MCSWPLPQSFMDFFLKETHKKWRQKTTVWASPSGQLIDGVLESFVNIDHK